MVTAVICSDCHLGQYYGRLRPERLEKRRRALQNAFANLVDVALERKAALFLIAGDLFDRPDPRNADRLFVARQFGLKAGAPVFIPFMVAFIALKDAPKNAWVEACVGIGGPLLGSLAAALCALVFRFTGEPIWNALAYTGFFLNLFNLAPIGFLDGGRIATALSPWLWVVGLAVMVALIFSHPNFMLVLILLMSLPRVWSLFRPKTDDEKRYFEVTAEQRGTMAVLYFGLVVLLVMGMRLTHVVTGA